MCRSDYTIVPASSVKSHQPANFRYPAALLAALLPARAASRDFASILLDRIRLASDLRLTPHSSSEELAMRPAALILLLAAASAAAQSTPWDYAGKRGPLVWGRLDPAWKVCADGHQQSPVDIRGAHLDKALQPIEFHYIAGPVTLVNDGRTVSATVDPGSYIVAGGVRYQFKRFEFHHPSEEAIKGKLADLEVDLIHEGADGKTAIIAIRFNQERGDPNAVLAQLWPHLPKAANASQKVSDEVNAAGFLPGDRGYWTYMGSLTSPPCTEGVRWFVYEDELTISRDQLRTYTSLFRMNSRPLQDLHGRSIEANE
jgi:carbonic anhydrase